jgi:large subunit ribosomal protein L31
VKKGIHPNYRIATVTCSCGSTFQTRTTVGDIKVEICSHCHPFFTGTQKLIDSAGRVEKYLKRYSKKDKTESKENQGKEVKEETK